MLYTNFNTSQSWRKLFVRGRRGRFNRYSTLFCKSWILCQNFGVAEKIDPAFFFRVRFWQCIFENQKWRMWLKSKSIPKVNSSILNVFEPKFSIFAKQQYPSFSTSLQRNVATWGLWYANTFVDFFSHINLINILKRFVFASKVNLMVCHCFFR